MLQVPKIGFSTFIMRSAHFRGKYLKQNLFFTQFYINKVLHKILVQAKGGFVVNVKVDTYMTLGTYIRKICVYSIEHEHSGIANKLCVTTTLTEVCCRFCKEE